jgi:cell division protein FtsL
LPPATALVYYLILLSYCQVALDYEMLGSSKFVQSLLSEVDEREKETLRLSSKIKSLSSLARSIKKDEGITGLRSGSRIRKVPKARRLFCQ